MIAFTDLALGDQLEANATITSAQLAQFCALTGENQPLHTRDGVIPGTLLQAVASGAMTAAGGDWDVVGLRTTQWRFIAPLHADELLHLSQEITALHELSATYGQVTVQRRISTHGNVCALGTLTIVMRRQP
ncbi:MAG: MaoC family dehydratase [Propionibacteriaceae bacterium]